MSRSQKSLNSTRVVRLFNVNSLLRTLYREGGCSRTKLAKVTHMSPATVSRIISELVDQQIIIEKGTGKSSAGRKPTILQLNYEKIYIAGACISRDQVGLAIADLKGKILSKRYFQPYSLEPESLIKELVHELNLLVQEASINQEYILGLGLAISGIVDSEQKTLVRSVNLGWREVKIGEILEKELELPVLVENDANAAALAELWFGGATEVRNFLYIKTDTGVGSGIISERNLLTGPRGIAGEIGHLCFIPDGRKCRCGLHGCLETYLYAPDITRRYEEKTGKHLESIFHLKEKVREGDSVANKIVDEAAEALSIAVLFATGLLDLDLVVIGGAWGALGDDFLNLIREKTMDRWERSGIGRIVPVTGSQLGESSDLLGAVGLVIHRWLASPI